MVLHSLGSRHTQMSMPSLWSTRKALVESWSYRRGSTPFAPEPAWPSSIAFMQIKLSVHHKLGLYICLSCSLVTGLYPPAVREKQLHIPS